MADKSMGMMLLEHTPIRLPGAIANPATYDFPMAYRTVPGAWTQNIVGNDMSIVGSYIEVARALEGEGHSALTTNCGFTARFQKQVAGAVKIPVAMSSLLLVPLMARLLPPGKKLGVVTYDAKNLNELHYNGAGWSAKTTPVAITGIEGSESWTEMAKPDPKFTVAMLERDVTTAARRLVRENPDVAMLVLECSAFPVAAAAVRRELGLPTVDFSTLHRFVMGALNPRMERLKGIGEAPGGGDWGALGVLRLLHGPLNLPGAVSEAATYPYKAMWKQVPGAWTQNVTTGDESVRQAYVECTREMVRQGCRAVVTTCGFTSIFQADMAAAVNVPVASSSLLMVPFVCNLMPEGAKVAVLTYDATRLTNKQCQAAGWALESLPVVVGGIEGTESWRQMSATEPKLTMEMLRNDVGGALAKLRAKHPEIRAVVFECAGFPSATDHVRATTGLPVFDILSLSDLVMWSVAQVRAEARAAAE